MTNDSNVGPPKHSAASLAALIASQIEPDHAEHLLAALLPLDGQPITKRLLDKLPGGRVEWTMHRHFGWTEIHNSSQRSTRGDSPEALNVTLAHSETAIPLDVKWVERENACYFGARRTRNAQRAEAIANPSLLTGLAIVMNDIEDLTHQLAAAKIAFATYVEEGEPCNPDRYVLERACGLREER